MKRIISFIMSFCFLTGIYIKAEENLQVNIVFQLSNPGNIYFTGDKEDVDVGYFNNSDTSVNLDVSYMAVGRKSNNKWEYEKSVSIPAGKSIKETIRIDFEKDIGVYDIYDLVISASDGNLRKTFTTEFSYAKRGVKNYRFGINTHYAGIDYNQYLERSMSILKNSGVSIIRDGLPDWESYETETGIYEIPEEYQNIIDIVTDNDIEILNTLGLGNALYTGDKGKIPVTTDEIAGFSNYAKAFVNATKGKIKYFEIWNEPNTSGIFNSANDDGTGYGELVKAVYPAIKEANPDAYVIGYSSSGTNSYVSNTAKTGAYDYMDAGSFHPYPEYDSTGEAAWATGDMLPETRTIEFLDKFRERALIDNLWITEQGWSDGDDKNSETLQAAYLVRAYALMMADGNVEKYFWYEFIRSALYGDGHEGKFGMLNGRLQSVPLGARPVFMSMTNMNSKLADAECIRYTTSDDIYRCDFEKINGDDLSVIWLKTKDEIASKSVTFDFGCKRLLKTDLYGNEEIITSETGVYEIEAGCDPSYYEPIEDEVEKFAYTYNTKTGICAIKGYIDSKEQGVPVNMMLYRPKKSLGNLNYENEIDTLSYFDQCITMENGVYEFVFSPKDGEGIYLLNMASENGELCETYIDLRSKLTCIAEVKGKSIDDIKKGENFTVAVNVTGENRVYKVYNVYVALFNENCLVNVMSKTGEVMDNELMKTTEIEMVADSEFDEIRVFAWESNMKPLGNNAIITKKK